MFKYVKIMFRSECRFSTVLKEGDLLKDVCSFDDTGDELFLRNGWPRKGVNPLSANPTKWPKTLKKIVGCYRRFV